MIFYKYILSKGPTLTGEDRGGTSDSCYGTQNKQENTQNNVIKEDTRRDITVDTDKKYQEKVETDANVIFQLKQRDQINKGHGNTAIPAMKEFLHVSSCPLL